MLSSADIRKTFLDFFASREHQVVPSAPIVVKNDPTLMFTNAGMNQFKDYFLGNKKPSSPRIADTQKCLRVSGKHNDLEEVGVDTYHHTMFEMLGNWSFGDYFKKEAIAWSWELLTEKLNIPKDRLYVTVFEGNKGEGIEKDEEAINEWKKWIAPDRILEFGKKDNFWEMGDTGPCGPCTEIHVDTRTDEERSRVDGKALVNADHPLVIEIWNNVFIQYNRLKNGSLQQLPARHVDTGMGFERLVRVLQQKQSNYDTDIFTPTIRKIEDITGKKYAATETGKADIAFRVLADHLRAICFTIADGQLPSNTGAGYVIRRILRRAVRYYYSYLEYQQPLLHQLINDLATRFENVFPELKQQEAFVTRVVREEEEGFLRTLEKGLKRIEDIIGSSAGKIGGSEAFELYDTYGFPLDLTRLIAAERNIEVDEEGFTAEMQKQKDRSRAATATDAGDWVIVNEGNKVDFVGYDSLETKANILRYRSVKSKGKELVQVVLDKTPFYAESGGQVGDTGKIIINRQAYAIVDTKKENDLIIHFLENIPADFSSEVTAVVDKEKRKKTALHHSATHLLHAALRKVLGTHVAQKGSLVNADYLRFDFSHFSKMTNEEIGEVEKIINSKIRENHPVVIRELPKEEAMKAGAMALFGEKYGDTVRVVTIDPSYSIELCGGTHVASTGELGLCKIISEAAVAAGVRRIEALCGEAAENFIATNLKELRTAKELLKNPKDISAAINSIQQETATLRKKLEKFELVQVRQLKQDLLNKIDAINGCHFIGQVVDAGSAETLKKLALELSGEGQVVVLAAAIDGKANVVVAVDNSVIEKKGLDAAQLIKQKVAPLIKGGGGGQKTLATAGGSDISALQQVIEAVKTAL
jgi:alanyl-tRNA synthetase